MHDDDRRGFDRLSLSSEIQYKIIGKSKGLRKALYKNISARGLFFETNEKIPLSALLEIYLNVPHVSGEGHIFSAPLKLTGKVNRVNELIKDELYEIAVHLVQNTRET